VYYPDPGLLEWLVGEVTSLAPFDAPHTRVRTVADALAQPESLVLLLPLDERSAVEELEAIRDQFLEAPRKAPVVLFLLRDGDGHRALAHAPGFASIIRGRDLDPEGSAEVDISVERKRFEAETGLLPDAWLRRWKDGAVPRNAESLGLSYWAKVLESR